MEHRIAFIRIIHRQRNSWQLIRSGRPRGRRRQARGRRRQLSGRSGRRMMRRGPPSVMVSSIVSLARGPTKANRQQTNPRGLRDHPKGLGLRCLSLSLRCLSPSLRTCLSPADRSITSTLPLGPLPRDTPPLIRPLRPAHLPSTQLQRRAPPRTLLQRRGAITKRHSAGRWQRQEQTPRPQATPLLIACRHPHRPRSCKRQAR